LTSNSSGSRAIDGSVDTGSFATITGWVTFGRVTRSVRADDFEVGKGRNTSFGLIASVVGVAQVFSTDSSGLPVTMIGAIVFEETEILGTFKAVFTVNV